MKKIIMLAAFIAAAASLSAGKFDSERPDWAPIEPNVEADSSAGHIIARTQLDRQLKWWATKHQVVSQYNPNGLTQVWQKSSIPGDVVTALTSSAINTLSDADQAEVDSLNRLVEIASLEAEKKDLEQPRRQPVVTVAVDTKQVEVDTIASLKESITSLQNTIANRQRVVSNDNTSLSTPVVAAMAGLGGISLASLIGLAFTRRSIVS
tara:strand:+ start:530 stop:1153 length:624 start_codon:yes stop_codon:yes gene_type:complete